MREVQSLDSSQWSSRTSAPDISEKTANWLTIRSIRDRRLVEDGEVVVLGQAVEVGEQAGLAQEVGRERVRPPQP